MRKTARQDQNVGALQIGVLVPQILGILAKDILGGVERVLVAVAAREDNDPESHLSSLT